MDDHNTAYHLRRILADTVAENGRLRMQRDELASALGTTYEFILATATSEVRELRSDWLDVVGGARVALAKVKEGTKP